MKIEFANAPKERVDKIEPGDVVQFEGNYLIKVANNYCVGVNLKTGQSTLVDFAKAKPIKAKVVIEE